jgi:hypothetical protein
MKRATAGDPTTTWKTPSSTAAATKPSPGPLKKKERMELKEAAFGEWWRSREGRLGRWWRRDGHLAAGYEEEERGEGQLGPRTRVRRE